MNNWLTVLFCRLCFVVLLSMASISLALAERYALLVGVGDYPGSQLDLDGPEHDINALEEVLIDIWKFKRENVQVLRDSQATKAEVLAALAGLKTRSQPGDQLFFYFGGHGTSAGDENIQLPLPDMTAGLLPYDASLDRSATEIVESLIVGRTDLRPIFQEIDKSGRDLLVMIDACYSGNAVRGFSPSVAQLPSRYVRLDKNVDTLLPELTSNQERAITASATEEAYPYNNIFFISAAGEYEEAADISGPFLQKFPTIDGKPHGAFTDAMLRVLTGKTGLSDTHENRSISHMELKQGIQNWLSDKFPQTPQHLPPVEEDRFNLASRGVFGYKTLPATVVQAKANKPKQQLGQTAVNLSTIVKQEGNASADDRKLRLSVDVSDVRLSALRSALVDIPDIVLTSVYPHFRLDAETGGLLTLRNGANDLVISISESMPGKMLERILQEVRFHQFFQDLSKNKTFEISLDVTGKQNNGPHLDGEFVRFSVRSVRNAWIVLLDIDREGGVNVLFPAFKHEQRLQPRNLVLQTPEIEVVAPFGTDRIVALGFTEEPKELLSWIGELSPRILPGSNRLEEILGLIDNYRETIAMQELDFITVAGR